MNPRWDDGRRRQEVKPQQLKGILKKVPVAADDWRRRSRSPGSAVDEPSTMQKGLVPGQHRLDPVTDEASLEMERVDVELARKRKELEEIEERIMHKKVAIGLRRAKPLVESLSSGFRATIDHRNSSSLRDRVHQILQQRHPAGFLLQARSPKNKRNSIGSSLNGLLQEQHPLKIRVKELMKRRGCRPCPPERAVTDVNPSPVAQPPADNVNMGFQRFLTVLNKGVDMDLLTKIVNDGCEVANPVETVQNHKPPAVVAEPFIPPSHGSKQSNSRDERRTDSGSHSLGSSSSRSRSPPAVRTKQKEEEKAKATEQHEQMQNILKTLGLNLEVGEISRLANRTQERLYGTKNNNTNSDHQKKLQGQPRKHRNSSSRSSSSSSDSGSSSSRSSSRSASPPCNRLIRSKDSLLQSTSKSLRGTEELPKHRVQIVQTIETSRQAHQQIPSYFPSDSSVCLNESFPQHGQYDVHSSGGCNQPMGPYWPPHGGANPPSYFPIDQPYQQNAHNLFHKPAVQPGSNYSSQMAMMEDLQLAPSLAESEGQSGIPVRPWCFKVISTQQSECFQQFNVCKQAGRSTEAKRRRRQRWKINRQKRKLQEQMAASKAKVQQETNVSEVDTSNVEEKSPPRVAKIKANLRIKLEVFNKEPKKKLPLQPDSNSCQSHLDLTD